VKAINVEAYTIGVNAQLFIKPTHFTLLRKEGDLIWLGLTIAIGVTPGEMEIPEHTIA
jgi:hypothetical protein